MKQVKISSRAIAAPPSPFRKLLPIADQAKKRGIKIYHVNIGDPDFLSPEKILLRLKELAGTIKQFPYANSWGLKELIIAWQKYYKDIGIDLDTGDILITSGGGEGLIMACAITADPGDEFIFLEPFYANYTSFANQSSINIKTAALDKYNNYHLPPVKEIISKINSKTKAIFFTNPSNPTGTVFTRDEVKTVVKLAHENGIFLISDETYHGICFDEKKCVSALHVANDSEAQNIIISDSASKKLNIPGARIGAIISKNKDVMDAAFRYAQGRLSVAYLDQEMVFPLISDCKDYIKWLSSQYENRRNVFIASLEKALGIKVNKPEGAFYTMIKLPIDDSEKFSKWLLTDFADNNETVMVAPGPGFYATEGAGKNEVRVAYVLNEKDLARAAELLGLAVKKYNNRIKD